MENRRIIYVAKSGAGFSLGVKPSIILSSVEELMKEPINDGDLILFEGGYEYEGTVSITGRKRVIIGSIGISNALIKAGKGDGICLTGCSGCEIFGIRIGGSGWRENYHGTGVLLLTCNDITVRNAEVFGFKNSGIEMNSCSNITVTGCLAHHNGFCGIDTCLGKTKNHNIKITHCRALDNAGNPDITDNHSGSGIVIYHADGVLVEYCEAAGNGWAQRQKNINGPVGIWCACDCKDVIFRKCISHHNRTQPGCVDGDGLDIDGAVINGYMEYNYSYDNDGSGYLFCEYGSGMEWSNNNMKYCISINDGLRVQRQGSVQFFGPDWLKLEGSQITRCLFVPAKEHHCIVNNEVGKECTGLSVSDCILVEGTVDAVKDPDNPYISIENNYLIKDKTIYQSMIENAPRLTDPRRLDDLPVFKQLQLNSRLEAFADYNIIELFNTEMQKEIPDRLKKFTYYLNGADFEGSDYQGELKIVYDSIQAGYALNMSGEASFIRFQYPAWNMKAKHMAVLKARLENPDTEAYIYVSENDRIIKAVNITGGVSEYHNTILEFDGFEGVPFIGIMVRSQSGNVMLEKIDICELPEEKECKANLILKPDTGRDFYELNKELESFISFGDVYEKENVIFLNGRGSGIFRFSMGSVPERTVSVEAEITADSEGGCLFIESGGNADTARIEKGSGKYRISLCSCNEFIKYGVFNSLNVSNAAEDIVIRGHLADNNNTEGNAIGGKVSKGNELLKINMIRLLEEVI